MYQPEAVMWARQEQSSAGFRFFGMGGASASDLPAVIGAAA
jgi:hypothetical protein